MFEYKVRKRREHLMRWLQACCKTYDFNQSTKTRFCFSVFRLWYLPWILKIIWQGNANPSIIERGHWIDISLIPDAKKVYVPYCFWAVGYCSYWQHSTWTYKLRPFLIKKKCLKYSDLVICRVGFIHKYGTHV